MTAESGGDRCRELRRKIHKLHDKVVSFYKRTEQFAPGADLVVANEFRYVLRLYMDADKRALGVVEDGEEEDLLLQTYYQLLILHHDMVDFVELEARETLDRVFRNCGSEFVARHINLPDFHKHLREASDLIAKSRGNREERHEYYLKMAEEGGVADKMMSGLKTLKEAEPYIIADAKKARWRHPWIVGMASAAISAFLAWLITWLSVK